MAKKTQSERREDYKRERGYIGTGGIVICGQCHDDLWFAAAHDVSARAAFDGEQWERYNPAEGDDWCSRCDRQISKRWREEDER